MKNKLKYLIIIILMFFISLVSITAPKYYFKVFDNKMTAPITTKRTIQESHDQLSLEEKISIIKSENMSYITSVEIANENTLKEFVDYLNEEIPKIDKTLAKNINVQLQDIADYSFEKNLISFDDNKYFVIRSVRLYSEINMQLEFIIDYNTNKIIGLSFHNLDYKYPNKNIILNKDFSYLDNIITNFSHYLNVSPNMIDLDFINYNDFRLSITLDDNDKEQISN